jgi:tetratricopeptide (TPR) repeat protein
MLTGEIMENLKQIELLKMGIEAYKSNDFNKAKEIFTEIIEENNNHIEAFFYLANIFHMTGKVGKAIRAFQKVVELDPTHTDAAISLSVLLNDIGKYEQAQKVFELANKNVKKQDDSFVDPHINKKFSIKHYELAELYFSYSRYEEAIFEYDKAYSLDLTNQDIKIKIAKTYSKKGLTSKAIDVLKIVKSETPDYLPAKMALGLIYYSMGNIIEAQNEWKSVLFKSPAHTDASMYLDLSNQATETRV